MKKKRWRVLESEIVEVKFVGAGDGEDVIRISCSCEVRQIDKASDKVADKVADKVTGRDSDNVDWQRLRQSGRQGLPPTYKFQWG